MKSSLSIVLFVLFVSSALSPSLGAPAQSQPTSEAVGKAVADEGAAASEKPLKRIKMVAENWRWSPKVIRVTQGTRVKIEFESFDASRAFVLKAYGLKVKLPQGRPVKVDFIADKKGEFRWRCGRPCGNGCAKMTGRLIVE